MFRRLYEWNLHEFLGTSLLIARRIDSPPSFLLAIVRFRIERRILMFVITWSCSHFFALRAACDSLWISATALWLRYRLKLIKLIMRFINLFVEHSCIQAIVCVSILQLVEIEYQGGRLRLLLLDAFDLARLRFQDSEALDRLPKQMMADLWHVS